MRAAFEVAGIDDNIIGRVDRYIRLEQLDVLLGSIFQDTHNPYFGLIVGSENDHGKLGLVGRLLASSSTLGDALETLLEYKNLIVPYLDCSLQRGAALMRVNIMSSTSLKFAHTRSHAELIMSALVALGRSLVGGEMPLVRTGFQHAMPDDLALYHEVFSAPLEFSCEENFLEIDNSVLEKPLVSAYPEYHQRLRQTADETLLQLARVQGMTGQILHIIERRLGEDKTSIEAIAASLGMTPRTLQRRLADEDATFAHLRDQVRHQRACVMLGSHKVEMSKIAEQLGFSDTANFYHAFKRWEGCAPGAYRRTHETQR